MSEQNAEIVRRGYEALNRGGVECVLDSFDPQVELVPIPGWLPDAEPFHGHDGVRAWFQKIGDTVENLRWEPQDGVEMGDRVVIAVKITGRGKSSGIPVEAIVHQAWTVRSGKAVRLESFLDRATALEAVGLSE